MKKIIELDTFSGLGGGPRVMYDVVSGLRSEFEFVIVAPKGYYLDKYIGMGLVIEELKGRFPVFEIRKAIKKENADILHVHGTKPAMITRLAVIGLKKKPKIVYTLHGLHIIRKGFPSKQLLVLFERFLNKWTDVLICVAEGDKKSALEYGLIPESKIKVIMLGIDMQEFEVPSDKVNRLKSELGLSGKFIITGIGRLHPQKDFSTALKGIKVLAETNKNIVFLIVGDGPLRADLEAETKSLGITENVRFLGYRKDIPDIVNMSDILLFSTNWEGFGLIPAEAGAARKPIVASDVTGPREVVADGKTGYLFKRGSVEELVEKTRPLVDSEALRKEIGDAGYEHIKNNFSMEKMLEKHRKLFNSL
jgi:glycosyltransferase involved in cell wall biosynthesis